MEAQVAKMKEAFESAASDMGGRAEVDIKVMYPGFKFSDGDHVVEVAKKRLPISVVLHACYKAAVAAMQTSLQVLIFQL